LKDGDLAIRDILRASGPVEKQPGAKGITEGRQNGVPHLAGVDEDQASPRANVL
jgi:hypothetical protein